LSVFALKGLGLQSGAGLGFTAAKRLAFPSGAGLGFTAAKRLALLAGAGLGVPAAKRLALAEAGPSFFGTEGAALGEEEAGLGFFASTGLPLALSVTGTDFWARPDTAFRAGADREPVAPVFRVDADSLRPVVERPAIFSSVP
jgi:hypothetical protein